MECAQSCLTLCDPMDYSPPGSSVQGILQARILKWVAIPFSRGSSHQGIEPVSPALQNHLGSPLVLWDHNKGSHCHPSQKDTFGGEGVMGLLTLRRAVGCLLQASRPSARGR